MDERARESGELLGVAPDDEPTLVAQVVGAVRFVRAQAPSEPFLGLMETEPDTVTAMLATGLRTDLDVAMAAEWIFRMVLSVTTVPGETFDADAPDELLGFFAAHLVRGLT